MKTKKSVITGISIAAGLALGAAGTILYMKNRSSAPAGVKAFKPFNIERYMGKWYEVARFDFRFEKGLDTVTAEYSLNADGSVKVVNRGYDPVKNKWYESVGKAIFKGAKDEARLLVSFFGPFYSGYNVVELDRDYKYALVFGRNLNYLWLLSRDGKMPERIRSEFLQRAYDAGYDLSRLIWTYQEDSGK